MKSATLKYFLLKKNYYRVLWLVLFIFFFSCEEKPLEPTKSLGIITFLTPDLTNNKADGKTIIELTVSVDSKVSKSYQEVSFSSSGGEIIGQDTQSKIRKVNFNAEGKATISWKKASTSGDYYITASIGSGTNIYKVEQKITLIEASNKITLTILPTDLSNIEADGKNTIMFTAKIDPNLPESYKLITFKCSNGKFVGENPDLTTRVVKINEKGEANVTWIVPGQAGKSYISASIGTANNLSKEEKEIDLKAIKASFKLQIIDSDKAVADATSLLEVRITDAINITNDNIIITSNKTTSILDGAGSPLKEGKLKIMNGRGVFYLQMSQTVENYFVKAQTELGDFFLNEAFISKRAYGESVFLETSTLVVPKDKLEFDLTTTLKRKVGKVSIGTPIFYEAYQDSSGVKKKINGIFKDIAKAYTSDKEDFVTKYLFDKSKMNLDLPITIVSSSYKNENNELISSSSINVRIEK